MTAERVALEMTRRYGPRQALKYAENHIEVDTERANFWRQVHSEIKVLGAMGLTQQT